MMSDVLNRISDQKLNEQEQSIAIELTDKELEEVHGSQFGCGFGGAAIAAQTLALSAFPFFNLALNQAAIAV